MEVVYVILEKSRTPGSKDLKPRKKKVLNPDYIALGRKEFNKLKKQDPGYRFGKYITENENPR